MSAIHIFKAGTHTDMHGTKLPFTQSDLAACVKAYDPSVHEAPLVIGHPKTEDPAWGWVKSLSLNGWFARNRICHPNDEWKLHCSCRRY